VLALSLALPQLVYAGDCEPHPIASLTKSGESTYTEPITGLTRRYAELQMKLESHISCAEAVLGYSVSEMVLSPTAATSDGSNSVNCQGVGGSGSYCSGGGTDPNGEQVSDECGASMCHHSDSGAGDANVTHTVKVLPGARYHANWRVNSGGCHDDPWGWSNLCGHTDSIDVPPVIEGVQLMGMDFSDLENPVVGPQNRLVVGKAVNITLLDRTPNTEGTKTFIFNGAGFTDERRNAYTGSDIEDLVPTQAGNLSVTLEVTGTSRLMGSDCTSTESSWTLTSAPVIIPVGTTPCPTASGSMGFMDPNADCDSAPENPDPEPDPSSKGDDSDSSGCSTAGSASFALMGLFPVFALALFATKRRRIGHRCDRR
jgi:MYXO-CTERM domain-containing protein